MNNLEVKRIKRMLECYVYSKDYTNDLDLSDLSDTLQILNINEFKNDDMLERYYEVDYQLRNSNNVTYTFNALIYVSFDHNDDFSIYETVYMIKENRFLY